MRNRLSTIFVFLSCLLVGCSIFSPAKISKSGYAIKRIDQRTYIISYDGISYAPKAQIDRYLFIRAAMLAKEGGFNYFSVDAADGTSTFSRVRPGYYKKAMLVQLMSSDINCANQVLYNVNSVLDLPANNSGL